MGEAKDPRGDDHIEELLSQLQGIFGKLSHSEAEESEAKIDPPKVAPPVAGPEPPPAAALPPALETPDVEQPPTVPDAPPAMVEMPTSEPPSAPVEPAMLPVDTDPSTISCVILYPPNRENEAKTLTGKVETMTPKFTKVEFHIKVIACLAYDPRGDVKETVLPQAKEGIRALFMVVDRPTEESRRKAIMAALEPRGIYFQEVPISSVEKKAFYTDLLLGMVFFYDSLRSSTE